MGAFINLLGQRFGRLLVVERMPNNKRKQAVWKCRCECGNEIIVEAGHLRSGHTQSCGCFQRDRDIEYHTTHGMGGTKLFRVFHCMKGRCYNPTDKKYHRYGARGIKICDEWLNDPSVFFEWAIQNGYKNGLSIDRIDNDGNYCPENCRWVDNKTQANNKSNNVIIEHNGVSKTISEWAEELGISYSAVKSRIKCGTFGKLFDIKNANKTLITHSGVTKSIKEWAVFLGLNYSTVRARVSRGTFSKLFPQEKEIELKEKEVNNE